MPSTPFNPWRINGAGFSKGKSQAKTASIGVDHCEQCGNDVPYYGTYLLCDDCLQIGPKAVTTSKGD